MDWRKEMEARLADDPRIERKKSRFSEATAFFLDGKEIAHFHEEPEIDLRLTAAGIFAMKALITHESIVSVSKDWVVIRLESEEDLAFTQDVLERAVKENRARQSRPKGKQTNRAPKAAKKSGATRELDIAKALKDLEEMKVPRPKPKPKARPKKKT